MDELQIKVELSICYLLLFFIMLFIYGFILREQHNRKSNDDDEL